MVLMLGQVTDWDAMEEHWKDTFARGGVDSKESALLFADSPTVRFSHSLGDIFAIAHFPLPHLSSNCTCAEMVSSGWL